MESYALGGSVTRNGEQSPTVLPGAFSDKASAQQAADWIAELAGLSPIADWRSLGDSKGGKVVKSWSKGDMRLLLGIVLLNAPVSKPGISSKPLSVRNVAPSAQKRKDGKQLYIVQSGRSSTLHLMLSRTTSTPNPSHLAR